MAKGIHDEFRVAIDIGGTFTDVVFMNRQGVAYIKKLLSTPDDYTRAIVDAIQEVFRNTGLSGTDIARVVHGCTVATNAVLEHTGARTGLITTKGFRDVLELRRFRMPELYNVRWNKPLPLSPRELRLEVDERIDYSGRVVRPLNLEEVEAVIDCLVAKGVESMAVCLLHSYVNPVHEQKIKEMVQGKCPDLSITISSELIPMIKEYERTSETTVNAYVRPAVAKYMQALQDVLHGIKAKGSLMVMQSSGSMMSVKAAVEKPVYIIESGPAAGVVGSAYLAKVLEIPNVLTLDMGGTTAKASIIENYEMSVAPNYEVGAGISMASRLQSGDGYTIRVPSIDIAEIGAGGGSMLWLDKGMALHVGPRSVGAMPGPVCYDRGGTQCSLTDTNLALGYLNPRYLAGGRLKLNDAKSFKTIKEQVATPLKMGIAEAAYGAHMIANSNMIRAIRAVSTLRGRDTRDFVLFAYGGSGPMHAAQLAREMEIRRVIVPPSPGVFSAFGLLFALVEHHLAETLYRRLDESVVDSANRAWTDLKAKVLAEIRTGGYGDVKVDFKRVIDARYVGQSSELMIPLPWDTLKPEHIPLLIEAFNEEHFRTYGHKRADEPVDLINVRLIARVYTEEVYPEGIKVARQVNNTAARAKARKAYFGKEYGWLETSILTINELPAEPLKGPAIVELYDATCVIPPYATVARGAWGTIVVDIKDLESVA